jgi:putative peptidoglycan lipid II flippase
VSIFAPGFQEIPGQFELASKLTRFAFPYIFFMSSAALGLAALNSKRRFVVTSFSPALLNVSLITAALTLPVWLASRGQPPVLAMAVGAIAGGLLQVVAQIPSLRAIGYFGWPRLRLGTPGLWDVGRRLAPTLLGVGVYYLDVIIGRRILSELGQGAITYYSYALRLCDFSQGIFVMALSSATLPTLSSFAARGQLDEVAKTFAYAMRHAMFIGILATASFVILAEPIVFVLLQHGQFDPLAADETKRALMAQGLGIFLVAGVRQLVVVYFALGDTKTPVAIAAIDVLVFATTALLLKEQLGHVGVSIAVTVARLGQFSLLMWRLKRHLPTRHGGLLATSTARAALSAVAAGGTTLLLQWAVPFELAESLASRLVYLTCAGAVLLGVFLSTARLLRSEEVETLVSMVRKLSLRLMRRP